MMINRFEGITFVSARYVAHPSGPRTDNPCSTPITVPFPIANATTQTSRQNKLGLTQRIKIKLEERYLRIRLGKRPCRIIDRLIHDNIRPDLYLCTIVYPKRIEKIRRCHVFFFRYPVMLDTICNHGQLPLLASLKA